MKRGTSPMRFSNTRVLSSLQGEASPSGITVQLVCLRAVCVSPLEYQFQIENPAQRTPRGEVTPVCPSSEVRDGGSVLPTGYTLSPDLSTLTLIALCASGGVA